MGNAPSVLKPRKLPYFSPIIARTMLVLQQQQQPTYYPRNFLCYESGQQQVPPQVPPQAPQQHFQAAPIVPRPQQEKPKSICRYWAKDGRCPIKRCPCAASHTAQNSPRYAKFQSSPQQAQEPPTSRPNALVIEEPAPARRANALLIKDPDAD